MADNENYDDLSFDELVAMFGINEALRMRPPKKVEKTAPLEKGTKNLTETYKKLPCTGGAITLAEAMHIRGVNQKGCQD